MASKRFRIIVEMDMDVQDYREQVSYDPESMIRRDLHFVAMDAVMKHLHANDVMSAKFV